MSQLRGTLWDGIPLQRVRAAPDPDSPSRAVALPVAWDEEEAAALAAIAPGSGPVVLPRLAEAWITPLAERGRQLRILADATEARAFTEGLRALLLSRRGAPGLALWRQEAKGTPRFVLNLPAFLSPDGGFDTEAYAAAVALAVRALDIATGAKAHRLVLGFADLAGLLAGLRLAYGSAEGRAVGAAIAALTRGAAEAESGRLADRMGAREPVALLAPAPPGETPVPGLAAAARAALDAAAGCAGLRHRALVALSAPDAVEQLLGAESGGLAPAAGPSRLTLDRDGWVAELPTRAALRAGAAAERLLAPPPHAAWLAMTQAISPFLHAAPPMPAAEAAPARPAAPAPARAPALPLRPSGAVWKVTVGGHRVVLRTTEDPQGQPVEIAIALTKEGAAYRSLMDAMMQSVSIALAAGLPLAAFVDAHAYTRFGPAGAVEGDPVIQRATSVLDWAFRKLAREYLGRLDLPDPEEADCAPDAVGRAAEQAPLLPLDLPETPSPRARRKQLRLVG
ncbi:TSCPD domain-containing protein [Roseomonas sp. AR75]|uniref:TSCPD domain-containing protein n=1 Tax=Roseomonas sp. AR75 TaxID=2562311 RepID=UPI0010C05A87|nr:TSCPD domain-containing protein [Roseomonas sp. AR75]